ncbi:MAG: hypothetical protein HYX65_05775 [Gemmatimonadetes bacterium]|nr:hypothetical protein [Gemmatimonadota bacterium]
MTSRPRLRCAAPLAAAWPVAAGAQSTADSAAVISAVQRIFAPREPGTPSVFSDSAPFLRPDDQRTDGSGVVRSRRNGWWRTSLPA